MKNLLFAFLLLISFSCKKDSFYEYRVTSVSRPGTYACKYTLTAPGKPEITLYDECGKYKNNQVVLTVQE